jgi:hypothetical protein
MHGSCPIQLTQDNVNTILPHWEAIYKVLPQLYQDTTLSLCDNTIAELWLVPIN